MQKKSFKQKCLAWILSLAVAMTFIPMGAGIAFATEEPASGESGVSAQEANTDITGYYLKLDQSEFDYDGQFHKPTRAEMTLYTANPKKGGTEVTDFSNESKFAISYPNETNDAYKKTGDFPVRVTALENSGYTGYVEATLIISDPVDNILVYKQNGINGELGNYVENFGITEIRRVAGDFTTKINTFYGDTESYVPVEYFLSKSNLAIENGKDVLQYYTYTKPEKYFKYWSFDTLKQYNSFKDGTGTVLTALGGEYTIPAFLMLDQAGKVPRGGAGWAEGQAGNMFPNSVSRIVYVSMDIANLPKATASNAVYNGGIPVPTATVKDGSVNVPVTVAATAKNVGPATATVTGTGDYYGTQTVKYNVVPKGTSLKYVKKGKKKFTARWYSQKTQTTGYQLRYSKSSNFSGAKYKTISKNKTVKKTVTKLKKKTRYYVQVRTYKTIKGVKYYSPWSATKSVKTK